MKVWRFIYLFTILISSSALAQTLAGERFDEDLPDPILSTETWNELKPGQVYQGYLKLYSGWNNNWPLCWQLKGDHLKLTKLHDGWVRENYFKQVKSSRIHDPQGYLTATQMGALADILKAHDEVSQLPIHLFLFGADQRLVNLDAMAAGEEFLEKPNSALMYYYMGDERATTGYVKTKKPPKIPGSDKDEEPKPLLDPFLVQTMFTKAGRHAASLNEAPAETLYATVDEVSRRMYWIEQELGLVTPTEPFAEVATTKKEEAEEPSAVEKLWQQLGGKKENLFYIGSGILLAVLLAITAVVLMMVRRLKYYEFPSYTGVSRLAAPHGAGVSDVVAFKDARVSLSDQKKRIEDSEV